MAVFIVTFELHHDNADYSRLYSYIKQDGSWACLSNSTYLVESESTAIELRDRIKQGLYEGDTLYVGKAAIPAAWTGLSNDVATWIKEKL